MQDKVEDKTELGNIFRKFILASSFYPWDPSSVYIYRNGKKLKKYPFTKKLFKANVWTVLSNVNIALGWVLGWAGLLKTALHREAAKKSSALNGRAIKA